MREMILAESFYTLCKQFCNAVDNMAVSKDNAGTWMVLLMRLYKQALELPETEPDNVSSPLRITHLPTPSISCSDVYWEVFSPLEKDDPVCGSFYDDLSDIYIDLYFGIMEYDAGHINNAIWTWKFGVDNHWGQHAVDAIRALHSIRTDY